MTDNNDKTFYGIWIFGKGWLRIKDDLFATSSYTFADDVSKNMGNARPRLIDTNLLINNELETLYLKQESRTACQRFKNFFKLKTKS